MHKTKQKTRANNLISNHSRPSRFELLFALFQRTAEGTSLSLQKLNATKTV